jgi:hypothetical protein
MGRRMICASAGKITGARLARTGAKSGRAPVRQWGGNVNINPRHWRSLAQHRPLAHDWRGEVA